MKQTRVRRTPGETQTLLAGMLTYIREYHAENGFSPSLAEITQRFELRGYGLASYYLNRLVAAGKITRKLGVTRSIVIVEQE